MLLAFAPSHGSRHTTAPALRGITQSGREGDKHLTCRKHKAAGRSPSYQGEAVSGGEVAVGSVGVEEVLPVALATEYIPQVARIRMLAWCTGIVVMEPSLVELNTLVSALIPAAEQPAVRIA